MLWQGPTTAEEKLRAAIRISSTGLTSVQGEGVSAATGNFTPGEGSSDYLLVAASATGWSLYGKNASTGDRYVLAMYGGYGTNGGMQTGLYFSGVAGNSCVKEATILMPENQLATQYLFEMNTGFDQNMSGVTSPDGAEYTDENGLDLTCGGAWKYLPESGWSALSDGKMVAFRAKIPESGTLNFQVANPDTTLKRKVYVDIWPDGVTAFGNSGHVGFSAAATPKFAFTPGNDWNDYLVKANEDDTYSVYILVNGAWKLYGKTEGYTDAGAPQNVGVQFSASGSGAYIKNVRILSNAAITEADAKPEGDTQAYYSEGFAEMPAYGNLETSGNLTVQNNVMTLTDSASFALTYGAIPQNGYAEFKVMSNSAVTEVKFYDGKSSLKLELAGAYDRVNGVNIPLDDGGNSWKIWRVVRNNDDTYSGFCRTEVTEGWYPAFANVSGIADFTGEKFEITQYAHGNGGVSGTGVFDYFRIYGPATDKAIVLTDGVGTKAIPDNGKIQYMDSLCAVVEPNAQTDRKLVFAEYDENGRLLACEIADILKGNEPVSVIYSVKSDMEETWHVRAFLWDGFVGLNPMAKNHTVKSGAVSWNEGDGWIFVGNAQMNQGVISMESADGAEASAEFTTGIGAQFDLSWTMSIDDFGGGETVQLSNGSAIAALSFSETGLAYSTTSGQKTVPYDIGNQQLTYRIVGNGNDWDLYIDGNLVSDMTSLAASSGDAKILFETGKTGSAMRVFNLSINSYDLLEDPTKTQGFDNGDMSGWTQEPVSPLDNDVTYEFWSCEDESLQVANPSYKEAIISKSIATGNDFIFESRMRFENFGNWFGMRMYLPNYFLEMEMRKEYFTLNTPIEEPNTSSFQSPGAVSDGLSIDPEKWYVLRIESYNNSKYARVYLDDVLIMEEELLPTSSSNNRIEFFAIGCHADDCIVDIDWVRYLTRETQQKNLLPLSNTTASATMNATQSGGTISASLGNLTGFETVSSVSYLLDGKEVATGTDSSYSATISGVTAENHTLEAVGRNAAGIAVARASKEMPAVNGEGSVNYSNEISYTVTGDGVAEFSNGNHKFKMTHSASGLTYLTDANEEETYSYGTGKFHIITDGPIAEVYRNGQFAFSFYMPRTTDVRTSFDGSITGQSVSVPTERKNYFVARNVTPQEDVYELADFSYDYNLDFVAGTDDTVRLSVNDGYYRTEVSIENGSLYVWDGEKRGTVPVKTLADTVTEEAYYRVETSGGMSRLYKNGRWITTFRGGNSTGAPCLSIQLSAGALSYLSVNDNTDVYIYEDDFTESGEVSALDFWRTTGLSASLANNNLVLDASSTTNAIAELYALSGDFDLSAKVNVAPMGNYVSGGFWFLLNHTTTNTYTKVGYNHSWLSKKYEIVDRVNNSNKSTANGSGSLPMGQTVQLDLKVRQTEEGEKITLSVNGNEVVSTTGNFERYGKIGFMLSNCTATIEEVSYRGNARPVPGVQDDVHQLDGLRNLLETDDGDIYMVRYEGGVKTSDGGESWEAVEAAPGNGWSDNAYGGWSSHILRLKSGKYISMMNVNTRVGVYGKNAVGFKTYYSNDGFQWQIYGTPHHGPYNASEIGVGASVNSMRQGPSGRVYFAYGDGASEDAGGAVVWYSDDEGLNWTHSVTIKSEDVGHVLSESVVIETKKEDGSYDTRLYFRNDKGYLCYYSSPNRGGTWDLEHLHKTPLIASMACFNIEPDPEDFNTLYVGWEYDNMNLFGRTQFPRTRWGVAKSVDGGNTWEYLGTVFENNRETYTSSTLSLDVSKDYVILSCETLDDGAWRYRTVMVPKDTAKTSKRFEQLHYQSLGQVKNTCVIPEDRMMRTLAINPTSGRVLLHGGLVENAAEGEYLSLDIAEAYLGAAVSVAEGAMTTIDGRRFVKLSALADSYGLAIVDEGGIKILNEDGDWSERQRKAFRYTLD